MYYTKDMKVVEIEIEITGKFNIHYVFLHILQKIIQKILTHINFTKIQEKLITNGYTLNLN